MAIERVVVVFEPATVAEGRLQQELDTVLEQGFTILERKQFELSKQQIKTFAGPNEKIAERFSTGPVASLILQREDAFNEMNQIGLENIFYSQDEYCTRRALVALFPKPSRLERTVAVVHPGLEAAAAEREILEAAKKGEFSIIWREQRVLSDEEARDIECSEPTSSLTAGESIIIVVEKIGAVDEMYVAMGPESNASETAPDSIRARLNNAAQVSTCSSLATADRLLSKLFSGGFPLQRTLALIKPDAVAKGNTDRILELIHMNGFHIVSSQHLRLERARAEDFYGEHRERVFFNALVDFMTSGPLVALVLAKASAIASWRTLCGPTNSEKAREESPNSIRALFGTDGRRNACHGSDSIRSAQREIKFFFPELPLADIPDEDDVRSLVMEKQNVKEGSEENSLNQVLIRGLTHLCHQKPVGLSAVSALAQWLRDNNPNKPQVILPAEIVRAKGVVQRLAHEHGVEKVEVVFVLGGPGSGKGTQCAKLVEHLGYFHISSGDCLRAAIERKSEEGKLISECISHGKLVPDKVVLDLIEQTMASSGAHKFLIDGFPRRIDQAFAFEKQISECDFVLSFEAPDEVLCERLLERGKSSGRSDDNQGTIEKRLRTFHQESVPAIEHYKKFNKVKSINANRSVESVWNDVKMCMR